MKRLDANQLDNVEFGSVDESGSRLLAYQNKRTGFCISVPEGYFDATLHVASNLKEKLNIYKRDEETGAMDLDWIRLYDNEEGRKAWNAFLTGLGGKEPEDVAKVAENKGDDVQKILKVSQAYSQLVQSGNEKPTVDDLTAAVGFPVTGVQKQLVIDNLKASEAAA